jgi:hypothetical protein
MSLKLLRSPFIFYCDVLNHDEIKDIYYPLILDKFRDESYTPDGWNCKVKITEVPFLSEKLFQDSIIWEPLDQMLGEVNLNRFPTRSFVSGIWANYYTSGDFQEVHDHVGIPGSSVFSGIYILDQKGENKTSFINNNFGILDSQVHTKNMDIKEGTVIIFPSNLLHYVNPVEDERCTVSFNIRCDF